MSHDGFQAGPMTGYNYQPVLTLVILFGVGRAGFTRGPVWQAPAVSRKRSVVGCRFWNRPGPGTPRHPHYGAVPVHAARLCHVSCLTDALNVRFFFTLCSVSDIGDRRCSLRIGLGEPSNARRAGTHYFRIRYRLGRCPQAATDYLG